MEDVLVAVGVEVAFGVDLGGAVREGFDPRLYFVSGTNACPQTREEKPIVMIRNANVSRILNCYQIKHAIAIIDDSPERKYVRKL